MLIWDRLLFGTLELVSRIEVPVRLFFFAFFPQPVCLIWVYVFISLKKNELPVCLFGTCLLISNIFFRILPNVFINNPSKKPVNNDFFFSLQILGQI